MTNSLTEKDLIILKRKLFKRVNDLQAAIEHSFCKCDKNHASFCSNWAILAMCFSFMNYLASYKYGTNKDLKSKEIKKFIEEYYGYDSNAVGQTYQYFRHNIMHLEVPATSGKFMFVIGLNLKRKYHMKFTNYFCINKNKKAIGFCFKNFLSDTRDAIRKLITQAESDHVLRNNILKFLNEIN